MILGSEIIILVCIALLFFFSLSETAVISANKSVLSDIAERNGFGARRALMLMARPEETLSSILIGSNIANISATAYITVIATKSFFYHEKDLLIVTVIQTIVFLIFCEALPKLVSRFNAEKVMRLISFPLWMSTILFFPLVKGALRFSRFVKKGVPSQNPRRARDEIDALFKLGSSAGIIDKTRHTYIDEIMSLHKITVIEAMTPTINIVAIELSSDVGQLINMIAQYKFSRIPVYNKRVDDIVGYVYYRDVLEHDGSVESIKSIMRKAVYVPLTKSLYILYREMQSSRNHVVFAVNEFGAVVGMVTREDIAEEIVGEIQTREHSREDLLMFCDDGSCSVSGVLDIDVFARQFDLIIDKKGFETVGGFVCFLAGKIPDE
ncbi:MAG TPA: hemolysin family protein, partial [Spirochaetota bacterium]